MVRGLLADANIEGHVAALVRFCQSPTWIEFWNALRVKAFSFADVGLTRHSLDVDIWRLCQRDSIVLVTDNRNSEGPDSLEAAIQSLADANSLPVLTLANGNRVLRDRAYAEAVAIRLMEVLDDVERLRGRQRIFLP